MRKEKIKEWLTENYHLVAAAVIVLLVALVISIPYIINTEPNTGFGGRVPSSGDELTYKYVTNSDLNAINIGPAYLDSIIIGNDLTGSTISVKNATDSAGAALKDHAFFLVSDTLSGVWNIGLEFANGIYVTVSPGLYSTFIYSPK